MFEALWEAYKAKRLDPGDSYKEGRYQGALVMYLLAAGELNMNINRITLMRHLTERWYKEVAVPRPIDAGPEDS